VPNNAPNRLGHRIFNYLVIIEYLKSVINPTGQWKDQLMSLLETVSACDLQAMGFPDDWLERGPWAGEV
jgi:abortive infection bacteriophage resistance protein